MTGTSSVVQWQPAAAGVSARFRTKDRITQAMTPEIVIALCGPLGTPLHRVSDKIKVLLEREHRYEKVKVITLSDFIRQYGNPTRPSGIQALIEAGNALRQEHGSEVLAELAIRTIAFNRRQAAHAADSADVIAPAPVLHHCHIIDSIKNTAELELLRMVYGPMLHVISVYAPLEMRVAELMPKVGGLSQVHQLIHRDSGEETEHGQSVRDIFPLADYFLRVDEGTDVQIENSLKRYLALLLGVGVITPTPSERAMHEAHSAARNSACLSRQVGAAITDQAGELLAVGWNDVPRPFGGLYESQPVAAAASYVDHRCWQRDGGKCFNDEEKTTIAKSLTDALVNEGIVAPEHAAAVQNKLRRSNELKGLIEFSRAVHAEMHALLNAGHTAGGRVRGGKLYVTTYPCHSCARHIIAAGITEVCFIEPYRKSLATRLHADAITESEQDDKRVRITPFDGVAPSRFLDLFSEGPRPRKDPVTGRRRTEPLSVPVTAKTLEAVTTLESLALKGLNSSGLLPEA